MAVKKAQISREVRAKFEEHGVDSMRAYLISAFHGQTGLSRGSPLLLTGGIKATRGDLEDWLQETQAAGFCWTKTGTIAAIAAAFLALLAWLFPMNLLAWLFPIK